VRGIKKWDTASGIRSIELHYSAFRGRDPETAEGRAWKEAKLRGVPGGELSSDWRKEQEIDFSIRSGMPVYLTYRRQLHVAPGPLSPVKDIPMLRGWDFGGTPAAAICQLTPMHLNVFPSLYVPNNSFMGIKRFGTRVLEHCAPLFPGFSWVEYIDPAGNARKDSDEKTCKGILENSPDHPDENLKGFGLNVQLGEVTWAGRFKAMEAVLGRLSDDGRQFLQIDPRERFLIEAFEGGYQRTKRPQSGLYDDDPAKNEFSHLMNALEYVVSRVIAGVPTGKPAKQQTRAETDFDIFNHSRSADFQQDAET
jgi:hypothetical protein